MEEEDTGICLECQGECNIGSQLCSFCMRKGIIPDTKTKCVECNSLNCYFKQCLKKNGDVSECMKCSKTMYNPIGCCNFYVCSECVETFTTYKDSSKQYLCPRCEKAIYFVKSF